VRGYVPNADQFCKSLSDQVTPEGYGTVLNQAKGFFSLVYSTPAQILVAVDRVRSLPMYYAVHANVCFVSDDAYWVQERVQSFAFDHLAATELLLTGYVTGRNTLVPEVKQLQAGEMLLISKEEAGVRVKTHRYYQFRHANYFTGSEDDLLHSLDEVLRTAFLRLCDWAAGRPLVIPLSGGYDSRLIALWLKRLKYDNVITFSYGKPGHQEALISQDVARKLNFTWRFVPYSSSSWSAWFNSKKRRDFFQFADTLTAIPHIQDWPAVWQLQESGAIPADSIIVPGHSADLLAGSRSKVKPNIYTPKATVGPDVLVDEILSFNYVLWDWSSVKTQLYPLFRERILAAIGDLPNGTAAEAASAFESWDCQERQARFVINSVRVYEFWGYDWWLPFWDNDFVDYWSRVPLTFRIGKKLYDRYVEQLYAEITGIPIDEARRTVRIPVVSAMRELLIGSKLYPVARMVWREMNKYAEYDRNQFGWYAIVGKERFRSLYTGRETINSFLALDLLGKLHPSEVTSLSRPGRT
jgi:asparagine synthase (glutamine-hydrolysing)